MVDTTLLHLRAVYGSRTGRAHIALGSGPHINDAGRYAYQHWQETSFAYPAEADLMAAELRRAALSGADAYFCPHLMHADKRTPAAAVVRQMVHADVDSGALDLDKVRALGAFAVASGSRGNGHVYVLLSEPVPAHWHQALARGLVEHLGADRSKVNTNDLLRPVGTLNHKTTARHDEAPTAVEFLIDPDAATPTDPRELAAALGVTLPTSALPAARPVGDERHVSAPVDESPEVAALVVEIQRDDAKVRKSGGDVDRSEDLCRVVNLCARQGLSAPQTRGLIRSLRPDLAAKLDQMGRDEVAHLHASYSRFTDGKRAEWEAERRSEAEFFAASAPSTNGALAAVVELAPRRRATSNVTLTDTGNADLLVQAYGNRLRYCPDTGRWLSWTGKQWQSVGDAAVYEAAREVVESIDADRDDETARHKLKSLSYRNLNAMVALAQRRSTMCVDLAALDARAYELNTPNGIVDLKTGTPRPHDPAAWHTKMTGAGYDPAAAAPMWTAFLDRTFGGDAELVDYVQRLAGLASIGEVLHHILPFLFGAGSNGKSVLMDVLTNVFGGYAITAPLNFLLAGRERHETEIARLHGARLVTCSEVNPGSKFDEAKVKALTGGDMLSGRYMRQDLFDFVPSHTLFLMGNHQPAVTGGGTSFWRRLQTVPFNHTVPERERVEGLAHKLVTDEGAAILAWVVSGARKVLTDGLSAPVAVRDATAAYAADEDSVGQFVADCLTLGDGSATPRPDVVGAYNRWCLAHNERPKSAVELGRELSRHGVMTDKGRRNFLASVNSGWRRGDMAL